MSLDRASRFDRVLPELFDELADARTPDYLEAAIERASSRPQRPAWTFPERWLPMEITTSRSATTGVPWRAIGALALIAILLAAVAAVYVGSRTRLPAPFGPAANGFVAYGRGGDIVAADPETGAERVVVGGPEGDANPRFSRDGSRIVFERVVPLPETGSHVMTVAPDGSAATTITPEPLGLYHNPMATPYAFSPDGRTVAITAADPDGKPGVFVVGAGGGEGRWLDLDGLEDELTSIREPAFRPPDGAELLLTADRSGGSPIAFIVDVASGDVVRTIVNTPPETGLDTARWSPDGAWISYATWSNTSSDLAMENHLIRPDGTEDHELPAAADTAWELGGAWSNDGTRMLVVRGTTAGWDESRASIVAIDGTGVASEIPIDGPIQNGCCYAWEWAPDDSAILGMSNVVGRQVLIDVASRTLTPAPWLAADHPAWQRVAGP